MIAYRGIRQYLHEYKIERETKILPGGMNTTVVIEGLLVGGGIYGLKVVVVVVVVVVAVVVVVVVVVIGRRVVVGCVLGNSVVLRVVVVVVVLSVGGGMNGYSGSQQSLSGDSLPQPTVVPRSRRASARSAHPSASHIPPATATKDPRPSGVHDNSREDGRD